jgi:hypothetical protein
MTRPAGVQIMAVYAVPLGTYAEGKYTGQAGGQAASFTFRIEGAAAPFFGYQDPTFRTPHPYEMRNAVTFRARLSMGVIIRNWQTAENPNDAFSLRREVELRDSRISE